MNETYHQYFIINKPYNMVSQFVSAHKVRLLGDLNFNFPAGTHAVGRLDNNSEGLLILTTNKKLTRLLFQGETLHTRTYLVQVNNVLCEESLRKLQLGVVLKIKGGVYYKTAPCKVIIIEEPLYLFSSERKTDERQQTTWLQMTLTEGKYHQIRKMMAAVRHRCLRLIRISIEDLTLYNLQPGEVMEIHEVELFSKLKIRNEKV